MCFNEYNSQCIIVFYNQKQREREFVLGLSEGKSEQARESAVNHNFDPVGSTSALDLFW